MNGIEQIIIELSNLPLYEAVWRVLFWYFGILPIAITYLALALQAWLLHRRIMFSQQQKNIFLAIDIPNNNDQSPKAVENMFAYLAGAHGNINLIEKWWNGAYQLAFSYEIIGIEGYIQFLIVTPTKFKDLVETAVYSQYPDAEINEIKDYTEGTADRFPDDEFDIWGAEFITVDNDALPIKLYKEFEHQMGAPEFQYKDPMASLMDLMSSLKKGEQLWYQILVQPTGFDWIDKFYAYQNSIMEKKNNYSIFEYIRKGVTGTFALIFGKEVAMFDQNVDEPMKMMNLKPGEKKKMEAVQEKINKIGYEIKIRMIYYARKEVKNMPKVVNGFVGYLKQFNTNDLNSFMPDTKKTMTGANYFFKEERILKRKNRLMRAFKDRDTTAGRDPMLLNVEELATIWHFPIDSVVKAPLMQKAAAKRIEAPMTLPEGESQVDLSAPEPIFDEGYEVGDNKSAMYDLIEEATGDNDISDNKEGDKKEVNQSKEKNSEDIFDISNQVKKEEVDNNPPTNLPFA